MKVRFWGGPLDGQEHELEGVSPDTTQVPCWMEPVVVHGPHQSFLQQQVGLYERDGLPTEEPYVFSWKGVTS